MSEEKKERDHYDDAVEIVDRDNPVTTDGAFTVGTALTLDLAYAQVKATLALADAVNALATIAANKTT